jgi:hypothetical protein
MDRRSFLGAVLGALAPAAPLARAAAAGQRTRWSVRTSEGFDALCFLGPLSGKEFYARYYKDELGAFLPRLPANARTALSGLAVEAEATQALLGPQLSVLFSGGPDAELSDLRDALERAETALLPPYKASSYWSEENWAFLQKIRPGLRTVLGAMEAADFAGFRRGYVEPRAAQRLPALRARLAGVDVIAEQERLLGRRFNDPTIEIDLLYFSKPHGIKVQGQRFLTHLDYPDEVVLRNAAHEPLHPPFDMSGPIARSALAALGKDPLLTRIVAEHDPSFGYNSVEGLLDEDTVEALEQIVSERLGFARPAAERWRQADGGMHVLAAGLYGLLKADRYDRTGGNLEKWLATVVRRGRLAPGSLHPAAAKVLGTSVDRLWEPRKT